MSEAVLPNNGSPQRRMYLWPLGVLLLIMGFALFGERGVLHLLQLCQQKTVLEQDLALVEQQNQELRKEIDALRSDRRYIERVARTELGMVRQDELVFQFATKATSPGNTAPPSY